MAMTAAPATAAAPMLAMFMPAPEDFEDPAAVVVAAAAEEALSGVLGKATRGSEKTAYEEAEDALETDETDDALETDDEDEATALVETVEALLTMLLGATLALEAPAPVLASVEDPDALPEADAVKQLEASGV
ncbi:hypothetical protein HWV62_31289 [Athelia sp. TMB]|nr:hypothetical protein HWV62_31289 [Athelia sp. TMB]